MTKSEQTALEELHLTPEQLAEKTARAEALARGETLLGVSNGILRQEVAQIIENNNLAKIMEEEFRADMKPPRKKRSDAGKPKPKPPAVAQKPGYISPEQALRLTDLIETREACRVELDSAEASVEFRQGRLDAAQAELDAYLLELQGKKTG